MVQLIPILALVSLALLHSVLGEWLLLRPLLQHADWPTLSIGRALGRRTLRFAWHLTSLAWLGLAAVLWTHGEGAPGIAAVVLGASGLVAFAFSRGQHFAWALFLVGALGALTSAHLISPAIGALLGGLAAVVLGLLALLHLGWALGLRWGLEVVLPTREGHRAMNPGPLMTLAVAAALAVAALLALGLARLMPLPFSQTLGLLAAGVFALRAIGEGRFVGLFKRVRGSRFATYDDLLFTPLCVGLSACFVFASNLEAL